jgi:acyl-CoA thioester hydrolase
MNKTLSNTTEVVIRFSECDALKMVWHGNYVKYFEDGREDFGKKFGLSYMAIYEESGLAVPLVHIECDFKKMVGLGETISVETTMIDHPASKIIFEYNIYNDKKELVCKGKTVQVFLDILKKELFITVPPFFEEWKKKYLK